MSAYRFTESDLALLQKLRRVNANESGLLISRGEVRTAHRLVEIAFELTERIADNESTAQSSAPAAR